LLLLPTLSHAQQSTSPTPSSDASNQAEDALLSPQDSQASPVDPGVAAVPQVPLPNRVNEVLPPWLRVRGEFRERVEGFDSFGFVADRSNYYWLTRFRLTATIQPMPMFGVTLQAQDARVANKTIGPNGPPFRDQLDLRMGYAEIGTTQSPIGVRAGRQELVYGDQRLVGHTSWSNAARTFDAAKVMLRGHAFSLDVFGGSVVNIVNDRTTVFSTSAFGNSQFYGAYGVAPTLIRAATVEPYIFYKVASNQTSELGVPGTLKIVTTGARWAGTLPRRLDYNIEMAVQTGALGADTVRAWAGHWMLRELIASHHAVHVYGETNYASGDGNPRDGRRGTFDQLYPTNHDKYGLADQVGWRNMHNARIGFDVMPGKRLTVSGSAQSIWLANAHDALYNASGAVLARVAGGATSTHVGEEIDVTASVAITAQIAVGAGYAHVTPGPFLKQATPGASYSAPYVTTTYVFLADK
jgi:hypothetical protein